MAGWHGNPHPQLERIEAIVFDAGGEDILSKAAKIIDAIEKQSLTPFDNEIMAFSCNAPKIPHCP
ncbi:MAG: hypothetical protein R3C44_00720 [Chloroflexota bacterium]